MKLVMYSGGYPEENELLDSKLLELVDRKDISICFIPTCSLHSDEDYEEVILHYGRFGIDRILKFNIDQPFSETFKEAVFQCDIIHLGGGNTFYFLKHLRQTGMLKELKNWVLNGGILSGLSAGAIMMTENVMTASFPSFDCDENEENMKNLKAMKLVDFEFFPHYKNSKRYDSELSEYSKIIGSPLYACPDGSGIVINNNQMTIIGKTACFYQGKKYFINK